MNMQANGQDKLFFDKVDDLLRQSYRSGRCRFSSFLDERQQALALRKAREEGASERILLYGGWEAAQRRMLGCFPEPPDPEEAQRLFPIVPVTLRYRKEDSLGHRDFLGSLMALEVKRELVGDILTEPGFAVLFLTRLSAQVAMNELEKVGRVGVKKQEGLPERLPKAFELDFLKGTVGSMRLDCVTAMVTNLSREKAASLIKSGSVSVNFFENTQVSELLKEGDILSIRGWGRYVVSQVGGESKKGRIHLTCGKYV